MIFVRRKLCNASHHDRTIIKAELPPDRGTCVGVWGKASEIYSHPVDKEQVLPFLEPHLSRALEVLPIHDNEAIRPVGS